LVQGPDPESDLGTVSIIMDTSATALVPAVPLVDKMLQITRERWGGGEKKGKGCPAHWQRQCCVGHHLRRWWHLLSHLAAAAPVEGEDGC
jgi:hypothetical protein